MTTPLATPDDIGTLLGLRRWAVVGATPHSGRPSHDVPAFLIRRGFDVVPVNPGFDEVLGRTCYPDLASVPDPIDVVELFRRSSKVSPHVDEAIAVGAVGVWMQLGVIDVDAAARARAAGLRVVMDRCPKIEML